MKSRTGKDLIVIEDPGASSGKACGSYGGPPKFASVSPYCARDDFGETDRLAKSWGHADVALESAWVSDPDGSYLLGQGAKSYNGSALSTKELKYKKALYKTLAMVGHFAQEFNVPNRSPISVGVLLPFNEFRRSQEEFSQDLKIALKNFSYCGKCMSFDLVNLLVRPEGAGVFMGGLSRPVARDGSVLIANIGFRNASALFHSNGKLNPAESSTSDLGYRWLVSKVAERAGYKDEEWIMQQIFSEDGDRDVKQIATDAIPLYWSQVSGWLNSLSKPKKIVFCGGTALLLKSIIKDEINNCIWPDELHGKVQKYEPEMLASWLYMDLYGVYLAVLDALKKS